MITFTVVGPIEAPLKRAKYGWQLSFGNGHSSIKKRDFWQNNSELNTIRTSKGLYVFALQTPNGYVPIYVGKATKGKGFEGEALNTSNIGKVLNGLANFPKGTPVIFFVVHPKQRGRANTRIIEKIETQLIALAAYKNPDLANIKGHPCRNWAIQGVLSSNRGNPSEATEGLRDALGLSHEAQFASRSIPVEARESLKTSRTGRLTQNAGSLQHLIERLKQTISEGTISVPELARKANLSSTTIYNVLSQTGAPHRSTRNRLSKVLDAT